MRALGQVYFGSGIISSPLRKSVHTKARAVQLISLSFVFNALS